MMILCLDSATPTARVAILDEDGRPLAAREATAARHSANLLRLCHETLTECGATPSTLGAIACGAGPGSFTGLRVGLAVAKGLAMPAEVPLVLLSSLAALALDIFSSPETAQVDLAAPCIDGGKGAVHVGLYRRDGAELVAAVGGPALVLPEAARQTLAPSVKDSQRVVIAGNGADRYAGALDASLAAAAAGWRRLIVAGPTAISIGRLGLVRRRRGEADDLSSAVPLYGRAPDITVKKTPEK
ncbi:MAG TPA: tRNA (adenosine(37)-N6)-threonylcarbamoyltransferase complex dimerization subunit type 1 TsaB [Polyangia bacterium]|jgi:tRNA threonylcarbamoyladenosine biosynthesis protein TsaB|nr:tRNA (adenosine(37)-N6)-threonylcarbamoyltransferase complex dimerization subunit type 1 TsaB [Polyangia bacterium]